MVLDTRDRLHFVTRMMSHFLGNDQISATQVQEDIKLPIEEKRKKAEYELESRCFSII